MAEPQKNIPHTSALDEEGEMNVDELTEDEVRMASGFTTGKLFKVLIGTGKERKLAKRMRKVEREDEQKFQKMERNHLHDWGTKEEKQKAKDKLQIFRKLQQNLKERPDFLADFFECAQYTSNFEMILSNSDIWETNFDVFGDFLSLLKNDWRSFDLKLRLFRETKDLWSFNSATFHAITLKLNKGLDCFYQFKEFPETLKKITDVLIEVLNENPGALDRFYTTVDFLDILRRTSSLSGLLAELDGAFLSDKMTFERCKDLYEQERGQYGDAPNFATRVRLLMIKDRYPEYREMLEDPEVRTAFDYTSTRFLGGIKKILFLLKLFKEGRRETAMNLLRNNENFAYVDDPEDFESAIPWVTTIHRPYYTNEEASVAYGKLLSTYLDLSKKNATKAQRYLGLFQKSDRPEKIQNLLFKLAGPHKDDIEKIQLFVTWCDEVKDAEMISAIAFFYQKNPQKCEKNWKKIMEGLPALFTDPKKGPLGKFIMKNADTLIEDKSDMDFITEVIGSHGKIAEEIIKGYCESLEAGVISRAEKRLVLEFLESFRVISPAIIGEYKKAKTEGSQEIFLARLNEITSKMTGAGKLSEDERALPYYNDLLMAVFQNNAGKWTSIESNQTCSDRSQDIAFYKIKPRYEIDLLGQADIHIKEDVKSDKVKTEELVQRITAISSGYENPEKMKQVVIAQTEAAFEKIKQTCGLTEEQLEALKFEDRLALIILDTLYGQAATSEQNLKDLLMEYEFAFFEDIREYIQGTTDRVSQAGNKDYALLCELNTFFSDRIKEINKRLLQGGFKNPSIAKVVPEYFKKLSQDKAIQTRKQAVSKLQPEKLGLTELFIKQIGRTLKGKSGKDYKPDEIREIIRRYEAITHGLGEKETQSEKKRTKAFYGQLKSQRDKTRQLAELVTGMEIHPERVNLEDMDVAELIQAERNISGGVYDPDQFEAYTVQKALSLFQGEKDFLAEELDKFVSDSGKGREVLNAYIVKNKETSNARMVGGVCVSGDNPSKSEECIWNLPNYFEMVLEDPETHRCVGLVLLHAFDEEGEKTLTASFNPSSTYLYKVDEKALFKGLFSAVRIFAEENGFQRICTSKNKQIRTNRTGGIFEKELEEQIAKMGQTYIFPTNKRFSFSPGYEMKEMDTLWEKQAA